MAKMRPDQTTATLSAIYPPASGWWAHADGILSLSVAAMTANRMTLHPFPVPAGTYDAIGLKTDAAQTNDGTVACTLAVYGSDANGNPDTTSVIRSGSVTLTAVGMRSAVFGTTWSVASPGRYWVGCLYVVTAAPTTAATVRLISNCTYPIPVSDATSIGSRPRGWQRTGITALPTDAFSTASWTTSTSSDVPTVGLRRP